MDSPPSSNPSVRGERLLPSLLDEIAHSDPTRVLYSVSKTPNPADGFRDVDARAFARAVDRCAWYIEQQLGGPGKDFPTLTYMGPQDLVYGILVLACIKTGYKLLLNSPRNSTEAHLRLFEHTDCHTFLLPSNFPLPVIKQILSKREMRVVDVPSTQYWLDEEAVDPYPYAKTFKEARHEPFVVLHTSGSTGWPKPIVQTNGTHTPLDAYTDLPSLGFKSAFPTNCTGLRMYLSFPLFHCAGIVLLLAAPIYNEFTIVLANFPPSPDVVNGVHLHANVQASTIPTAVLVEICKEPKFLDNLSRLKLLVYGGGPCPQAVGDLASTKTHVAAGLGTTEAGIIPNQPTDPEDWSYLSFSPTLGSEYRLYADGLYEHFIVRDDRYARFQGIFNTFPSLKEWPMKDLYSKHPTKENVWLYRGRTDDIIVYHTGEKLNPLGMEDIINSHPSVSAALVAGQGKFQSSLLVEAATTSKTQADREALLDIIWPSIEAANKDSPSHARIFRNMVMFTSTDKPMLRAGKGTVQRKMTLELYETEIEALYEANESSAVIEPGGSSDSEEVTPDTMIRVLRKFTGIDLSLATPDANLFEIGLDSLQVTYLARRLNQILAANGKPQSIGPRGIYSNPTVAKLSEYVAAKIKGHELVPSTESDEMKMQRIYDQLSASLPVSARQADPRPSKQVVLLTGSTGSLGNYILESLIRDPQVTEVYCLNRGPDSASRQNSSREAKGFLSGLERVHLLDSDLSKSHFGLPIASYKKLLATVTSVIHNAWQVDFNLDVSSFTAHVTSVRRFIDFSAHSRFGAHLFFVSSISTVSNLSSESGVSTAVPEQIFNNWNVSQPAGYGQSKLISERLLDLSAREADIPATVFRVGQIAGPTTQAGLWPKQEWLPSLIASSALLGKLPDSLGQMDSVDWIPVDLLGRIIVDLTIHDANKYSATDESCGRDGASVYHLVNPQSTTWSALLPTVSKHLAESTGKPIDIVPLSTWVEALSQSAQHVEDAARNPATKILETYEGLLANADKPTVLGTKRAAQASQTLSEVGPVTNAWMDNWLHQWAF